MNVDKCTPDELALSNNSSTFHCLTHGQLVGLLIVTLSGTISFLAVFFVFSKIFVWAIRSRRWLVVQRPIELYLLSLFTADLLQSLGAITDAKWVLDGKVQLGSYCRAQGFLKNLGETNVAMDTLIITVYTFTVVWWGKNPQSFVIPICAITISWISVILFTSISLSIDNTHFRLFYAPTPYWCWIGPQYLAFKIAGEYVWLWLALLVSILCYVLLFFWSRGNIIVKAEDPWWKCHFHRKREMSSTSPSLILVLYPLAYSVLVLPISITRWIQFIQEGRGGSNHVPSAATIAASAIFNLSGVCNVFLFFYTRQGLFYDEPALNLSQPILALDASPRSSSFGLVDENANEVDAGLAK